MNEIRCPVGFSTGWRKWCGKGIETINHNLDCDIGGLIVRVFISKDGTDRNIDEASPSFSNITRNGFEMDFNITYITYYPTGEKKEVKKNDYYRVDILKPEELTTQELSSLNVVIDKTICGYCGHKNKKEVEFCSTCGAAV